MFVPFIDLSRTVDAIKSNVKDDWQDVLDHTQFVGGKYVAALESRLASRLDVDNFLTCANGTDALIVALQALGVGPGKKVAVPNMTFWAPFEAIVQVGATPVLLDIDAYGQMDFVAFQEAYKKWQFDAAILVHLYGWCTPHLQDYRKFCQDRNVALIEDAAQAFGVKFDGRSIFAGAQVATTSFYPAKVFGGCSDGGGVATGDPKLAERLRALCNHGRAGHYTYDYVGWNSRMGGLTASYLLRVLEQIDVFIDSRKSAEQFYHEFFSGHEHLEFMTAPEGVTSNGYLNVMWSSKHTGDVLARELKKANIGSARTYPQTLHRQPPARSALQHSDMAHSVSLSEKVINLPLFAGITIQECRQAAEALVAASNSDAD